MIRRLPFSGLAWLASTLLLLQSLALNWSVALTWPTLALAICTVLKLRECRRPFDRRLVALLQLLTAGLLAAQSSWVEGAAPPRDFKTKAFYS